MLTPFFPLIRMICMICMICNAAYSLTCHTYCNSLLTVNSAYRPNTVSTCKEDHLDFSSEPRVGPFGEFSSPCGLLLLFLVP